MTVQRLTIWVGAFGALTVLLLALNLGFLGPLFALFQLGGFVGAPLAAVLHHELRSWPVVVVVGIALSIALTSLAAQALIWFGAAGSELLVAVTTFYGVVLARLLSVSDLRRDDTEPSTGGEFR